MTIEMIIHVEDNDAGSQLLADVFLLVHSQAACADITMSRVSITTQNQRSTDANETVNPSPAGKSNQRKKRATAQRPMGELRREVYEAFEKHRDTFFTMKEGGVLCGKSAEKIKSTVNGAYHQGEFERKRIGNVYAYRIGSTGLEAIEKDRRIRKKPHGFAKAA